MHLSLCHLFLQYSKEVSNDKKDDDVENNNIGSDCKRGRERGREKKRIMEKKRGVQLQNCYCIDRLL